MRRFVAIAFAALIAASNTPAAAAEVALPSALQVLGNVTNAARPVANALVIALNLTDLDAVQTWSTRDGSFTLPPLRSGIYKIIAVKQGFAPAITTIIPTKSSHRVSLALEDEKKAKKKSANQEIWEIRGSLPPDILQELDAMLAPAEVAENDLSLPRFRAEMVSLTGMGAGSHDSSAFAQTSLGLQSRVGDTWQLGVRGSLHRVEDPTDSARFGSPAAQASVMSMELRSSPTDAYRINSTKSTWRYAELAAVGDEADMQSHSVEWEHGDARVGVRYFAQENVFRSQPFGSDLIEISGGTTLMQTRRSDIGLSIRVTQESLRNGSAAPLRSADLTANGSVAVVPSFVVHYGMSSRVGIDGTEWAPRTGAVWKLSKGTALVGTAMYKVLDPGTNTALMPSIVVWSDENRFLPRYAYSFGIVRGDENTTQFSAVANVTAIDAPLRVIFTDGFEQFWDGLFIESGDVRRDVRITFRKDIAGKLAVDISTTAGNATPLASDGTNAKTYLIGDLQSIFFPTGTSVLVSYRGFQQPQANDREYRSERVNFRMAQSLRLPLDLKLLLGLELARAENSPFLVDTLEASQLGTTKKYIGGLAMNF